MSENKRSRAMGGAEDEVLPIPGADDPHQSSRAKDALFADKPKDAEPGPALNPKDTPPQRHEPGGPYDEDAAEASFFKANYEAEETNKKGGDE